MGFAQLAVGAIGAVQVAQQGAIGKYNQAVANRNALVKEQEAQILDDKLNLELAQFDKSFRKLQGTQVVNTLKSGATFSGTARNIALSNLYEAEDSAISLLLGHMCLSSSFILPCLISWVSALCRSSLSVGFPTTDRNGMITSL